MKQPLFAWFYKFIISWPSPECQRDLERDEPTASDSFSETDTKSTKTHALEKYQHYAEFYQLSTRTRLLLLPSRPGGLHQSQSTSRMRGACLGLTHAKLPNHNSCFWFAASPGHFAMEGSESTQISPFNPGEMERKWYSPGKNDSCFRIKQRHLESILEVSGESSNIPFFLIKTSVKLSCLCRFMGHIIEILHHSRVNFDWTVRKCWNCARAALYEWNCDCGCWYWDAWESQKFLAYQLWRLGNVCDLTKRDRWPCYYGSWVVYVFNYVYMSVSINGVYKNYDHMHVAFPRIIPANHTTNHTRESYHESYPWFWSHVLKHAGYYYCIGSVAFVGSL